MQPQLRVHAFLCKEGYKQLEIPIPKCRDKKIETNSLPDTGAKITVVGINLAHSLGIKKSELIPLSHGVNPANNTSLKLMDGLLTTFSGADSQGVERQSRQLCYVAEGIDVVFLFRRACTDLGLIHQGFPQIGNFNKGDLCVISNNVIENELNEPYEFEAGDNQGGLVDMNK